MDTATIRHNLERIGFSTNEAKAYLTLATNGSSKAGKISKQANLDRSSTYNALKTLIQKGIVSYVTIGKTRWFQISDPKNIITYLDNKVDTAKKVIPKIDELHKQTKRKEDVTLYKGTKGIKTVFEDILRHADENLMFGSEGQFGQTMPRYEKQFSNKMKKRGVRVKSIIRTNREIRNKDKTKRKIPSKTQSPVVTNIYKDKIAIIIWSETPEAILIQNKKASDAYRDYFTFMWKYAEK